MVTCSNCQKPLEPNDDTLTARSGTRVAAVICRECTDGAKVVSLVLRRGADGTFEYVQFMPIEMNRTLSSR